MAYLATRHSLLHTPHRISKHRRDTVFPCPKPSEIPHYLQDQILSSSGTLSISHSDPRGPFSLYTLSYFLCSLFPTLFPQRRQQTAFPTLAFCSCFSLCFPPCYLSAETPFILQSHHTGGKRPPPDFRHFSRARVIIWASFFDGNVVTFNCDFFFFLLVPLSLPEKEPYLFHHCVSSSTTVSGTKC